VNSDISEEKTQIKKIKRLKKNPKNNISPKFGQIILFISLLVKKNYHELRQIMQINLWYYTSSVCNLMFLVKNNISPKFGQQRSYYKKKQQKNTTKFLNFGQQRSYIAHTQQRRTGHTGGI
jgi:hypothetical protein